VSGFVEKPDPVQVPGLLHLHTGKVRDLYRNETGDLVMVAGDRVSAYDWVLPTEIPDKGRILTQLSLWWFEQLADLVPNHVISTDVPEGAPADWEGRTMVCRSLRMIPVECVARGYLVGSGLKEYRETGMVCGIRLPEGLTTASKLPEPIFTPATKEDTGHDINISFEQMAEIVGLDLATKLRDMTLSLYAEAAEYAATRDIIIADTKFEFGLLDGRIIWIDEVLTPDSSRFWPADQYVVGSNPPSYDKQYVRDWLEKTGWDKNPPAPELEENVVEHTRAKYLEAYRQLTGEELEV
jgi:phosphoribosylaminoimidazole-succinocarboxamide synthase